MKPERLMLNSNETTNNLCAFFCGEWKCKFYYVCRLRARMTLNFLDNFFSTFSLHCDRLLVFLSGFSFPPFSFSIWTVVVQTLKFTRVKWENIESFSFRKWLQNFESFKCLFDASKQFMCSREAIVFLLHLRIEQKAVIANEAKAKSSWVMMNACDRLDVHFTQFTCSELFYCFDIVHASIIKTLKSVRVEMNVQADTQNWSSTHFRWNEFDASTELFRWPSQNSIIECRSGVEHNFRLAGWGKAHIDTTDKTSDSRHFLIWYRYSDCSKWIALRCHDSCYSINFSLGLVEYFRFETKSDNVVMPNLRLSTLFIIDRPEKNSFRRNDKMRRVKNVKIHLNLFKYSKKRNFSFFLGHHRKTDFRIHQFLSVSFHLTSLFWTFPSTNFRCLRIRRKPKMQKSEKKTLEARVWCVKHRRFSCFAKLKTEEFILFRNSLHATEHLFFSFALVVSADQSKSIFSFVICRSIYLFINSNDNIIAAYRFERHSVDVHVHGPSSDNDATTK